MQACSLKPTLYLSFHLESSNVLRGLVFTLRNWNVLLGLQRVDGAVIDPIWNNYNKCSKFQGTSMRYLGMSRA